MKLTKKLVNFSGLSILLFFFIGTFVLFNTKFLIQISEQINKIRVSGATNPWVPVYAVNFADPTVLNYNGQYYGYATSSRGSNVASAISSDAIHWSHIPDTMPNLPSWVGKGAVWAPSVIYDANNKQFVMFYSTPPVTSAGANKGKRCIGRATATSPTGPFVDNSSAPFLCQPAYGGSIDPAVFVDNNGSAYLYVKNAGNSMGVLDRLWVVPLTSSFTLPKGANLTMLLKIDQSWQGNAIEGPGMILLGGKYFLFYVGNNWTSSKYAIGYAICDSAMGPCKEGKNNPILSSQGTMLGPGSPSFFVSNNGQNEMAFAAWYNSTKSSFRALYVATITLSGGEPVISPFTGEVAGGGNPPPPPQAPPPQVQPPPQPAVTSTNLGFTLLLHGIGSAGDTVNPGASDLSNKNPLHPQRAINLWVYNSSNQVVATGSGVVNFDSSSGTFQGQIGLIPDIPTGTYTVKVKTDRYLRKQIIGIPLITNGQVNQMPTTQLVAGDTNGDNRIDVLDYNALLDCGYGQINPLPMTNSGSRYASIACQAHTTPANVDFDDNGIINSADYNLFLRELSVQNGD